MKAIIVEETITDVHVDSRTIEEHTVIIHNSLLFCEQSKFHLTYI